MNRSPTGPYSMDLRLVRLAFAPEPRHPRITILRNRLLPPAARRMMYPSSGAERATRARCSEKANTPWVCQVGFVKIFRFSKYPNQWHMLVHSGPTRDVRAIVTTRRAGMRWTQRCRVLLARKRRQSCVRRSRVVLAPRPWRLSFPACAGEATVTKNAAHRGEHV
jgi:hypothetical protein